MSLPMRFAVNIETGFIRSSKLTQAVLADRFGVSTSTISEARRGITWNDEDDHTYLERREQLRAAA